MLVDPLASWEQFLREAGTDACSAAGLQEKWIAWYLAFGNGRPKTDELYQEFVIWMLENAIKPAITAK